MAWMLCAGVAWVPGQGFAGVLLAGSQVRVVEYSARMSCEFLMFTTFLGVVYGVADALADDDVTGSAGCCLPYCCQRKIDYICLLHGMLSRVLPGLSPVLFTVSSSMVYGTAFDVTAIGIAARIASCRAWSGMGAAS